MILQNKGIQTTSFYIPPFDLNEGEIIVINLFNGRHFHETEMFLKDLFISKTKNKNVRLFNLFAFVEHFFESPFRRLFYPVTVKEYLKKNADLRNSFATKIYEIKWISEKTKVNCLATMPGMLLRLYAALSKKKNIVFDLVGLDPQDAQEIYALVRQNVRNGGSAILLDHCKDRSMNCSKYIELQWIKNNTDDKAALRIVAKAAYH
jgi:hypothetical protein